MTLVHCYKAWTHPIALTSVFNYIGRKENVPQNDGWFCCFNKQKIWTSGGPSWKSDLRSGKRPCNVQGSLGKNQPVQTCHRRGLSWRSHTTVCPLLEYNTWTTTYSESPIMAGVFFEREAGILRPLRSNSQIMRTGCGYTTYRNCFMTSSPRKCFLPRSSILVGQNEEIEYAIWQLSL